MSVAYKHVVCGLVGLSWSHAFCVSSDTLQLGVLML